MREKERLIVTGLVVLMLLLWLGFPFHQSPRFAGSMWGGILGVAGAVLMLIPLFYLVVKRVKWLKKKLTRRVSMRTLLAWHIYAGVLGPILVVIHSGHKFASPLGIALTAVTLLVVVSGFVGRYLMSQFSKEIREKKTLLRSLQVAYRQAADGLAVNPHRDELLRPFTGFFGRLLGSMVLRHKATEPAHTAAGLLRLSESIADVEYSIKTHEKIQRVVREVAQVPHRHIGRSLRLDGTTHLGGDSLRVEVDMNRRNQEKKHWTVRHGPWATITLAFLVLWLLTPPESSFKTGCELATVGRTGIALGLARPSGEQLFGLPHLGLGCRDCQVHYVPRKQHILATAAAHVVPRKH